eukprot:TRINITY_DN15432_c0_g2_i1.p1 TRINITY_DN15432_c0_g2~~TRINITY_DN15432_c0_g2_i1.p1  ORF type:complete len:389 (+),score=134.28 TRINITY_DN15432_c0_g2_i1:76-1167(+)
MRALGRSARRALARRAASAAAAPATTDAIVMQKFGGVEVLEYASKPLRALREDECLVELAAAGVNPIDTYIRRGIYATKPDLPFTPGLEGAGRVVAVGSAGCGLSVGDPVAFTVTTADGGFAATTGSYAQHCIVKATLALPVPKHVDLAAAAALPIAYLAAHRALFHCGQAKPTDRILVRGASGAVGLAAVHLAQRFGSGGRPVVGTAGDQEIQGPWGKRIRHWGATVVTGHHHESIAEHGPFDVIVEQMARFNLASDARLAAPGARIVVVGSPPQSDGRSMGEFDCRDIMTREASIRGLFLWRQNAEERKLAAKDIFTAFDGFEEAPPVHRMKLTEARKAHDMVDPSAGQTKAYDGKIVLLP